MSENLQNTFAYSATKGVFNNCGLRHVRNEAFIKEVSKGVFMVVDTKRKYASGLTLIGSEEALLAPSKSDAEAAKAVIATELLVSFQSLKTAKPLSSLINQFPHNKRGTFRISKQGKPVFELSENGRHLLVRAEAIVGSLYSEVHSANAEKRFMNHDTLASVLEANTGKVLFSSLARSNGKGFAYNWFVLNLDA